VVNLSTDKTVFKDMTKQFIKEKKLLARFVNVNFPEKQMRVNTKDESTEVFVSPFVLINTEKVLIDMQSTKKNSSVVLIVVEIFQEMSMRENMKDIIKTLGNLSAKVV